jgi:hypothetical protein
MTPYRDITDEQWQRVLPLFPELDRNPQMRGRPPTDTRAVLNGVLWVIYSGAAWSAMPRRYPAYQTCHRRFKQWHATGIFGNILAQLFGENGPALSQTIVSRMRPPRRRGGAGARPAPGGMGAAVLGVPQPSSPSGAHIATSFAAAQSAPAYAAAEPPRHLYVTAVPVA